MNVLHNIIISQTVLDKLANKHGVKELEVEECFLNYDLNKYLKDNREEHQTNPPTLWFISETHRGRKLKIIFIARDGKIYIKSAFEPNQQELTLFHSKI